MTVSFLEIAAATTKEQVVALLLAWLSETGLPSTAWQERSVPRLLLEAEAVTVADLFNLVAAIANGNVLELSKDEWLTQLADNAYDVQRKVAIPARGTVWITNNSGVAQTITAGQLLVRSTQTLAVYRNLEPITIADGISAPALFQADEAGLAGNAAVNTVIDVLTPIPGVTLNNPGVATVWLTQIGSREEADDSLRTRCRARWTEGGSATLLTYEGWALAVPQVRQARVFENDPGDGKVKIIIAGDSNPLDGAVIASTAAYILPRRTLCTKIFVDAAFAVNVPITCTVYARPGFLATAGVAADAAIRTLIASKKIGERLYRAEIIDVLMEVPGVGNATIAAPATDLVPAPTAILSLLTAPSITVAPLP